MEDSKLDNFIICKKCHTLHRKIKLHHGTKALCQQCNTLLYRHHQNFIDRLLALSLVEFIALIIAFSFTIIKININGIYRGLDFSSIFYTIFHNHYYIVGIIVLFFIFIFPIVILLSLILALILMKLKRFKYLVKRLLILIAKLSHWSMIDIFLLSILVAMVKLFDYAQLEFSVAFIALILVILLDIFTLKRVSFSDMWEEYENIYRKSDSKR